MQVVIICAFNLCFELKMIEIRVLMSFDVHTLYFIF